MSETKSSGIDLRVPLLRDAETRRSYANALVKDITCTAAEMEENPSVLRLSGLHFMTPDELLDVTIALHRSLIGPETRIYANVHPLCMSASMVTTLRNLPVLWYTLDFVTLNVSDLKALGRSHDLSYLQNLQKVIDTYQLRNFTAVLNAGLPQQTKASLQDSIQRAAHLGAGAIELKPGKATLENPGLAELIAHGAETAKGLGYEPVAEDSGRVLFVLPAYREAFEQSLAETDEQFGIGCGAVSRLEGMRMHNTEDITTYVHYVGDAANILIMDN